MPNDYITINALAAELNEGLADGRINKVNLPGGDTAILDIRAGGKNHRLLLSAASALPRVHLTEEKAPANAPPTAFCMLLRKHLTGGILERAETLGEDRIVALHIRTKNELHDTAAYRLILELMGGASNLILTDGNLQIYDAYRRIYEGNRPIAPFLDYKLPPLPKRPLSDAAAVAEAQAAADYLRAEKISATLSGLSKESVKELAALSLETPLADCVPLFADAHAQKTYAPCVLLSETNAPAGYYIFPYAHSLPHAEWKFFSTLNQAADAYFLRLGTKETKQRETRELRILLKRLQNKIEKRLADNRDKLEKTSLIEQLLQQAEILKCNLHQVEKGENTLTCYDFYNDKTVTLKLDPTLSPTRNVELYYKRYHKTKGAKLYAEKETETLYEQKAYLASIEAGLANASTQEEYAEIAEELRALTRSGKKPQQGKKKEKKSAPLSFTMDGFRIFVGKNNTQNEEVTFRLSSGSDIWLHAKHYHGAHAVIVTNGKPVPAAVLETAAACAAYYSGARAAPKAEVDYTEKKHVKRAGKPGLVHYTGQKTIVVEPRDAQP